MRRCNAKGELTPMTDLTHSGRLSLIDGEVTWRLTDEALIRSMKNAIQTIPYVDISGIRLITFAGAGGRQGRAIVTTSGHGKLKLGSHHYVSLGNFENRSASYAPFVRQLARCVVSANPQARFTLGSFGLWLAWVVVCLLVLIAAILVVMVALEGTAPWLRVISVAGLLVVLAPFAVRWAGRSRPQRFAPTDIPDNLL